MNKNIDLFNRYIKIYMNKFEMSSWSYSIGSQEDINARATVYFDTGAMLATFCYSENWIEDKKTTEKEIKQTCFHEVFELILAGLRTFSEDRETYISEREINIEVHRIIRKMENIVFPII